MKKKLILAFVFFHLLLVTNNNVFAVMRNYFNYYHGAENEVWKKLKYFTRELIPFIWWYETYSGAGTNYGFYAPSVASDYLVSYQLRKLENGTDENLGTVFSPSFKRNESVLRFRLCYQFIQKKLERKAANKMANDMVFIILKQISVDIKKDAPSTNKIVAKSYLYLQPTIKEFKEGKKSKLIPLQEDGYLF